MNGKHGPGGHNNPIQEAWCLRFGLSLDSSFFRKLLSNKTCWQLAQCRTDEARRLILGVSS